MGVRTGSQRSFSLCWNLVILTAIGTGLFLQSLELSSWLLVPVVVGYLYARICRRSSSHYRSVHFAVRSLMVASLVIPFFAVAYHSAFDPLATPVGSDLVLASLLAAQLLLLTIPAASSSADIPAALVATGHVILLCSLGEGGGLVLILLLFVFYSVPFWLAVHAEVSESMASGSRASTRSKSSRLMSMAFFSTTVIFAATVFFGLPRHIFDVTGRDADRPSRPRQISFESRDSILSGDRSQTDALRKRRSGFSEKIFLAGVTGCERDEHQFITIRCYREDNTMWFPREALYLRGITLDTYADGCWTHNLPLVEIEDCDDLQLDGWSQTRFPGVGDTPLVFQDIELKPISSAAIFALPEAVSIMAEKILTDFTGTFMFTRPPGEPIRYRVASELSNSTWDQLREVEIDSVSSYSKAFTRLPRDFAEIKKLAIEVGGGKSSIAEICRNIEKYLRDHYAYSLTGLPAGPKDPTEAFLFEHRSGCCIDFASAMAIMLRTLNIPSRVACGFAVGEAGDVPGEYIFRGTHAHAWVEAYLGKYGWIKFDPTPSTAAQSLFRSARDYRLLSWIKRISHYTEEDRKALLKGAGAVFHEYWWLPLSVAVALVFFFRLRSRGAEMRRQDAAKREYPRKEKIHFYEQFIKLVARAGLRRPAHWTPRELARAAAGVLPAGPVHLITETYCGLRFGDRRLDAAMNDRIEDALAELRTHIKII